MWKPGWIFLCNACGSVEEFTVSADGEIVLAFLHASIFFIGCLIFALERVWRRFFARCALHFAGKLF